MTFVAWVKREPVVVSQIVAVAIALAAAFGLPLDDAQQGSILGAAALLGAFVGRSAVVPVAKLPRDVADDPL